MHYKRSYLVKAINSINELSIMIGLVFILLNFKAIFK